MPFSSIQDLLGSQCVVSATHSRFKLFLTTYFPVPNVFCTSSVRVLNSIEQFLQASLAMRRAKQAVKQVLLASDPDLLQYQRVNDGSSSTSSGSSGQFNASKSSPLRARNGQTGMPPPMVDEHDLQARLLESLVSASAVRPARNAIFKLHQSFVQNQEGGSANREGSTGQQEKAAVESTTAASLSTNSAVELLARATLARSLGGQPSSSSSNGRPSSNAAPFPPPSGPTQTSSSSSSSQASKTRSSNGWPAAGDKPDPLRPMELARRAWERYSAFFSFFLVFLISNILLHPYAHVDENALFHFIASYSESPCSWHSLAYLAPLCSPFLTPPYVYAPALRQGP